MQRWRRVVLEDRVEHNRSASMEALVANSSLCTLSLNYPHPSRIEIKAVETLMDQCNNSLECSCKVTFKEIWALNSSQLIKKEYLSICR